MPSILEEIEWNAAQGLAHGEGQWSPNMTSKSSANTSKKASKASKARSEAAAGPGHIALGEAIRRDLATLASLPGQDRIRRTYLDRTSPSTAA